MDDQLLEEKELFPFVQDERPRISFMSPSPTSYDRYLAHIDNELKGDTPLAYGLHPNAEIEFRMQRSFALFTTLDMISPKDQAADDDDTVQSPQHVAENTLNEILETIEVENDEGLYFMMDDIEEMLDGEKGPFQNCFIQECDQMNELVQKIITTLKELEKGFAGELTVSDAMEELQDALYNDRVPDVWAKLAWPSKRSLGSWIANLQERLQQLVAWTENPIEVPNCTWISGLRNPQSFLTAIMQETAQQNKLELDKLMIVTEVTKMDLEKVQTKSREGTYIHGLFMEGARWNRDNGIIEKSLPKEMSCRMPVIICKAVPASSNISGIYACPCYKTQMRGPTYVFSAQLRTKSPAARWILASVALIMDIVE
jgi:dynein heavy chain